MQRKAAGSNQANFTVHCHYESPVEPGLGFPLVNNNNDLRFGARGGDINTGSLWTGRIDEMRFYDTVLDVAQIQQLAVGDGAAFAPIDYIAQSATLSFAPGQTSKTITVQVNGDEDVELDETFFVNLFNPTGGALIAQAVGTIQNDDVNDAPEITSIVSDATLSAKGVANDPDNPVTVSGEFFDVDTSDTHTVTVDWGDGSAPEAMTVTEVEPTQSGSFSGSHVYATGGIFTVTVSVDDGQGGITSATTTAVVTGVGLVDSTLYVIGTDGKDIVDAKLVGGGSDGGSDGGRVVPTILESKSRPG